MLHFARLQLLALASITWLATGCGSKEEAPQPQPRPSFVSLNMHTVAVRYQARPLGGATSELPKDLNLLVEYERVYQAGLTGYRLAAPSAQLHDLAVSDTTQEVPLSLIATYPDAVYPKVTVTMWQEQAVPTVASAPYEITCDLVLDGKVARRTTYVVAAGQLPPLVASSQTEVIP
jgi:hypothetical protein